MENLNRYQKAALVSNSKKREEAIKNYYINPNICINCGKVVEVGERQKVSEIRKKKFCDGSCSAKYNNKLRGLSVNKKEKVKKEKVKKERFEYLLNISKKDLFDKCGIYYRFRAIIRKHAHFTYNKNNGDTTCKICGYDKHIQVCHIKSVSSFSDNSLISEINNVENLIGLCPNHHWEFDNGLISL